MPTKDEIAHEAINDKLEEIGKDVRLIKHHLFEGNGRPSIVERLALVEDDVADDVKAKKSRTAMYVASISGLCAVIAAVVSVFGG